MLPTLLDIAKANGSDAVTGLIDETTLAHPEIRFGAARPIKGINYKTLVRVGLPGNTAGSFRSVNAGTAPLKSVYENRLVETYILEPRFKSDKAVADAYEDGAQAYIAMEAAGIMEGEMQGLCSQFYYGTSNNAAGFPGLMDSVDTTNMVVDATGTTATTGSSVWLVKFGPQAVQWVWGLNGTLTPSPVRVESITDAADSTKQYDGYVQTLLARPGLQVGSVRSICRIKNLTAQAGKTLTDTLLTQALAKFQVGIQPDVILMTRRSNQQLQASRTATTPTGAPAPFPTAIAGVAGQNIPIYLTDAIKNTETIA